MRRIDGIGPAGLPPNRADAAHRAEQAEERYAHGDTAGQGDQRDLECVEEDAVIVLAAGVDAGIKTPCSKTTEPATEETKTVANWLSSFESGKLPSNAYSTNGIASPAIDHADARLFSTPVPASHDQNRA